MAAARIYARYVNGGEPTHAEYKTLQDWLFRYVAREAGRLGMAVHIHSFEGFGNGYRAAGADPLLLESAVTDPALQQTRFVDMTGLLSSGIVQGGMSGWSSWESLGGEATGVGGVFDDESC